MKIIYKKLSEITPYENNPRKNDKAVDAVAASIKEFGFRTPIVIDEDGVIVCGHTRYKAAKKLKIKSVPCVIADDLSEEEVKAYRLADNKTAEKSKWDFTKLYEEIPGLDMDLDQFGFNFAEPDEPKERAQNIGESEELDLSEFDDESFDNVCPCCGFRFND